MAISTKTDIVLGVSLAADPLKYMEAMERLRQLDPGQGGDFSSVLSEQGAHGRNAGSTGDLSQGAGPEDALGTGPQVPTPAQAPVRRKASGPKDVYGQLEAFVMQTFIQSMLPKDATAVFGKGTAGEVWRSMMAEKMGAEAARSGKLGIASRLAKAHLNSGLTAREAQPVPAPLASTIKSAPTDLARAPNALANALASLQEKKVDGPRPDTNGWITTVEVADRS